MGFGDTDIARDILAKRYYRNGESSPRDVIARVANAIAGVEDDMEYWTQVFFDEISTGRFVPNSPALVNAGYGGGLFACFVLGMEDSLSSITSAKADAMAITKSGGGWGIYIGSLRPKGFPVSGSTHGVAGGPIGFLETMSSDMKTMTQGGFRDAACMATMNAEHIDILDFIRAKSPTNSIIRLMNLEAVSSSSEAAEKIANRLLSDPAVAASSETHLSNFNMSVLVGDEFMERVKHGEPARRVFGDYSLSSSISARDIFSEIVDGMWENGEPGILFIDTIRARTPYDPQSINATNPCGEQALPPNGSCCLGHINLSEFVDSALGIDYGLLETSVHRGIRFLDNMITQNSFPTPGTRDWALQNRSIGLGVMGWADALIKLGVRYDSEEAINLARNIGGFIRDAAKAYSAELAKEKGEAPAKPGSGMRNVALMSIAPTGTVSLLAGCSPGIEPIYRGVIVRVDQTGTHKIEHQLANMDAFVTLKEIEPRWVIDHVAAWSQSIDNSISWTLNVPHDTTKAQIADLVEYAWKHRCNGVTVYRDGSRVRQVLNDDTDGPKDIPDTRPKKRPHVLAGNTYKYVAVIDGIKANVYVTVNSQNDKPWEVFVHTPHIKTVEGLQLATAVSRLSSLALRNDIDPKDLVRQLERVEGQSMFSIPAVIAKSISTEIGSGSICRECGSGMIATGGCWHCDNCGYSACK